MKLDLNCDLGEGEPPARTRALMRWITSANVACGGHAGDLHSMQVCVRLARAFGVRVGAHPGPWSRADFGRGRVKLTGEELELLLLQQVGGLERIARAEGAPLHHIKLHGGLYHASEHDPTLGRRYVSAVRRWWAGCVLYASAGGNVARMARQAGLRVREETFADRAYRDDATLVPRSEPGALLTTPAKVRDRLSLLRASGEIETITGRRLRFRAQTICIHADTPHAVALARIAASLLR